MSETTITFGGIRALAALGSSGSFSAAATILGVTQPALSQRIAALERAVGADLVVRSAGGASLTPAGLVWAGFATELDRLTETAQQVAGNARPMTVSIGVTLTSEGQILDELATELAVRFPRIRISVHQLWTTELVDAVESSRLDVAFARHPPWSPRLRVEHLWDTPLEFRAPPTHRFADRAAISLTELAEEPLAVVPRELSPGSYDVVESAFLAAGVVPQLVTPPFMPNRVREMVTDAMATVGPQLGAHETPGGTVSIPIVEEPRIGLHLVTRSRDRARTEVAAVAQVARRIAASRRAAAHVRSRTLEA